MADLNIGNSSSSVIVNAKHNGSVTPQINNTYDLGTSSLRWKNIYGNLKGNADTATTATNLASAGTWTWTGGTTAGPTASLVLGGKTTSIGAIPSASSSASGIITTGTQTIAGEKTFTSNLLIKRNTPNLYITDTNTGVDTYSIIRFGSTNASGTTNANAAYIFLNGPQCTKDGGANLMTIRNNVGDLRLNNDVINTGKLTVGQETKNASYNFYVNGTSYFNGNTTHNGDIIPTASNARNIGSSSARWGSAHIYKTLNIYGNEVSDNSTRLQFNASDNNARALIAFNGNVDNSLGGSTHLLLKSMYGDIRLESASGFIYSPNKLHLEPTSGEGGEIHLDASKANITQGGIVLDQQSSTFRVYGIASADGTTKTGVGTPLVIDPWGKTITGGYTITGDLNGNANTATKFALAQSITLTGDTTGTASSQAGWSIGTTTYKLTNIGFLDTVEKLDGFIESNKLKYATVGSVGGVNSDGMIISVPWSDSSWGHQIFLDDSAMVIQHRHRYAKTNSDGSAVPAWSGWATLLDSNNYNNYAPTKTGGGASGTWDVSISGSSKNISYPAQLTTNDAIDAFNIGNVFQVSTWNNTSSPGVSNGIIINAGWTNATYGAQIAIDDDPTYFMALRQRGGDGWNAWKRIPMGDGTGASGTWGINISGNAATSTISRSLGSDNTMKVYGEVNNEVNFGGTNNSGTIYFGYRAKDSKPIPSKFIFGGGNGTSELVAGKVYGAVWNDYAEYRSSNITEPGRVIVENGDGTLSLSTERLQRGAEIISDTFGFAIGETDECKTPIAVSGRVLAYYSGDIKEFKPGYPVCSGPNGTVSVMTEEEEEKYPSRIIGTVSEIPTYEKWGTGNVEVNGRIWIRIR